ncbi:hypothetical protein ABI59_04940 [Acidobacteria bacterium Mor1]|nr:hypothetical protein ABI59_04940 [Acidobacteria bacterium Mor1]
MEILRIPQRVVSVGIMLEDGHTLEGEMYVPEVGPDGLAGRVIDRLNDPNERYIPVAAAGNVSLVNKFRIASVRVAGHNEVAGLPQEGCQDIEVRLRMKGGKSLNGHFRFLMPYQRSRLVDFMNDTAQFMPLVDDDSVTLVHDTYIVQVWGQDEEEHQLR